MHGAVPRKGTWRNRAAARQTGVLASNRCLLFCEASVTYANLPLTMCKHEERRFTRSELLETIAMNRPPTVEMSFDANLPVDYATIEVSRDLCSAARDCF